MTCVFATRRQQGRLVGEVRQVRTDHPRSARGDRPEVDIAVERDRAGVDFEDLDPAVAVGCLHGDAPVEATGTQQGRVQDVRAVGRRQDDDGLRAFEAVHFREDLVECLLPLVVCAADGHRALTRAADRVELVDEDDRGLRLAGLGEQVADTRGTDADDRLDELRGRDREEGGVRLAGHGAGEQRLAGARRAREKDAVWHAPAQPSVAFGGPRKSTISASSALASSMPATSAKVTLIFSGSTRRACDLPKLPSAPMPPPALAARRAIRTNRPTISSVGPKPSNSSASSDWLLVVDSALISTAFSSNRADSAPPFQKLGTWVANSFVFVGLLELGG